jgi:hypothetical protein
MSCTVQGAGEEPMSFSLLFGTNILTHAHRVMFDSTPLEVVEVRQG